MKLTMPTTLHRDATPALDIDAAWRAVEARDSGPAAAAGHPNNF